MLADAKTHSVVVGNSADLVVVFTLGQHVEAVGVEAATARVQLLSIFLGQLRAEGVDGDDECTSVSLELQWNIFTALTHLMTGQRERERERGEGGGGR